MSHEGWKLIRLSRSWGILFAGQKARAAKVNVNTAGAEELQTLPGVGPATAKAIIAWREENGRFRSVDDLLDVSGIGKATLAKFRDRVSV